MIARWKPLTNLHNLPWCFYLEPISFTNKCVWKCGELHLRGTIARNNTIGILQENFALFSLWRNNNKTNSDFRCYLITPKPLNLRGQMRYHMNLHIVLRNVSHSQMKSDPLDRHQGPKTFTALLCTFNLQSITTSRYKSH